MARILLVDDDPQIVNLLQKFLEFEGHTVVTANNGKKALNELTGSVFDIIITDIVMPECDGLEVLSAINKMPVKPKVIAMSGGSSHLDQNYLLKMAKLLEAGVILPKPLELSDLSSKIHGILSTQ